MSGHQPFSNLAQSILVGSFSCGEALKPYLNTSSHEEHMALYPMCCYEFVYFFTHLMNRFALSILGNESRIKLQDKIGPLIVIPAISGFFDHWPEDRKEQLINHFYEDLNDAELDYSLCKDLLPPSVDVLFKEVLADINSSTTTYLFAKLISRIFELSDKSLPPEGIAKLFEISTQTFIDMNLEQQIRELNNILGK
jgi:hypothetical protein